MNAGVNIGESPPDHMNSDAAGTGWSDKVTTLAVKFAALAGKIVGTAERIVDRFYDWPAPAMPPSGRVAAEQSARQEQRGVAVRVVGLDSDGRPDAVAGPETLFLDRANVEKAIATVPQPRFQLAGTIRWMSWGVQRRRRCCHTRGDPTLMTTRSKRAASCKLPCSATNPKPKAFI